MTKISIIGEGLVDYIILKNVLTGYFNNKNIHFTRLLPKENEPVGWSNVLNYISSEQFKMSIDYCDFLIISIDTLECDQWGQDIEHIGDKIELIDDFAFQIKSTLINIIGQDFYNYHQDKIIFAIVIHEIECWLIPFITDLPAKRSKIVGCVNVIEQYANKEGFSIHEKHYKEGKHYDLLSKSMSKSKILRNKSQFNPSLNYFLNYLDDFLTT